MAKFRHRVFADRHLLRFEEILPAVCADVECELVQFNARGRARAPAGQLSTQVHPVEAVNSLQGVSSRRTRQEFPDLVRHYYRANRLGSGSYFAGSVGGAPMTVLRQYIEQQNRPG